MGAESPKKSLNIIQFLKIEFSFTNLSNLDDQFYGETAAVRTCIRSKMAHIDTNQFYYHQENEPTT